MQSKGNLLPKGMWGWGGGEIQKAFLAAAASFPLPEPTSRTHLCAARATAVDTMVLRVSFPPKPPPILFTRTKIRLAGTPNMFATKLCGEKTKQNKNTCSQCITDVLPVRARASPVCTGLVLRFLHPRILLLFSAARGQGCCRPHSPLTTD